MNPNPKKPTKTMAVRPDELIIDILWRLPVKTLLRFRCLSKQFRSIIDGPNFVKRHLQYHSLDHQRLIVHGRRPQFFFLDLDLVDNGCKPKLPFKDWSGHGYGVYVIGSCDGLLALSNMHQNSIGLWNLSTKKHQILPRCLSDFNEGLNFINCGFGRDAATDDYKLVRIAKDFRSHITEVSVYSLKANCWRRIDGFSPYSSCFLSGMAAFVAGTLNWLGDLKDFEDDRDLVFNLIVCFDLKNEIFLELSLPDTIVNDLGSISTLMVLRGCLGIISTRQYERVYDIWVMKEYGLKDSWTKMYSIQHEGPPIPDYPKAYFCSMHEDKIFILQVGQCLFRYDLEEEKFEIFKLRRTIGSVSTYVESLVSPNVNN